jgi:ABC-type bacteriocin/lantibiotic exporter with double-glycine peptidase domain
MRLQPLVRLILLILALAGASGVVCGAPAALWLDVPFVSQPKEGCGAAVISMVTQYWAKQDMQTPAGDTDVSRIQAALYSARAGGISASAMTSYFRENGFRTFAIQGGWEDLEHHIALGRPLVVSLAPPGRAQPLHYVVVTGVDTQRGFVFLNDPAQGKLVRRSREAFAAEWKAAGNWTLLALPWPAD